MTKIGLWGGSGSGKTTYLAALALSVYQYPNNFPWTIYGMDDDSSTWLEGKHKNLREGVFPVPTTEDKLVNFCVEETGGRKRQFEFSIYDRPGGRFSDDPDKAAEELAGCSGFILLLNFRLKNGKPFSSDASHIFQIVNGLRRRVRKAGKLPYSLIVCLSQYDDDPLFKWLNAHQFIKDDLHNGRITPYVNNPKTAISSMSNGPYILNMIKKEFSEERTKFVPLSSIGFKNLPDGKLDRNDCCRIIKTPTASYIYEPHEIMPVNVWYPFSQLSTEEEITQESGE